MCHTWVDWQVGARSIQVKADPDNPIPIFTHTFNSNGQVLYKLTRCFLKIGLFQILCQYAVKTQNSRCVCSVAISSSSNNCHGLLGGTEH